MSYNRQSRGGRRHYRDDEDDRRRDIVESPQERLKFAIIKLGEADPYQEISAVESRIRELAPPDIYNLSESFHIGVTEQPYKIPFYAALLRLLHDNPSKDGDSFGADENSLGKQILEEFWKGFQAYVDKLMWRETRLCIHFFAHLTSAQLISPESFAALLQSFTAVLDEFGVSHGRAKRAALCAAEGLMIAGAVLTSHEPAFPGEVITSIQTYTETTGSGKWIVQPVVRLHSPAVAVENADELLDTALIALKALESSGFEGPYPRPYSEYHPPDSSLFTPFSLPSVLVPPEVIELETLSSEAEESEIKRQEWPEYFLRLFSDDVTPDPNTPAGYAVRSDLLVMIDIFEVNRKEAARLLLEYPKWVAPGTFKPKPGAPPPEMEHLVNHDWQLESTLLETMLGASLVLPQSSQAQIYYDSLITEVCKLSPSTVGPAVGKSIRKLYSSLTDGLDVEIERRFSEWFAIHMSNFNFQWVWKEWIPDLDLAIQHPKRAFMRTAVEHEIRLSYYDRVAKSLPEAMHALEAHILPKQAPGPDFMYDDISKPHHDAAQSILNLFRGRAKAEDVIVHLDTLRNTLESEISETENVNSLVRIISTQSLLHVGSRSFSHLLNAIERYLPLLRTLASGGVTASAAAGNLEAKADILSAAALFWKYNPQMVAIVFDKLMQYQIVDPTDVVSWTFLHVSEVDESEADLRAPLNLSAFEWNLLKAALDKAIGRVNTARRKLAVLRKEDDDNRARAKASGGNMDVDGETKPDEPVMENPALAVALKAFSSLTREQKTALSRTLEGFVSCLAPSPTSLHPNPKAREILTEHSWHNRANWGKEEWNAWETWGWYRHFCRAYSPYLRNYATTFTAVSFARFEGQSDPASDLLQKIWDVSIGQE
ncbi:MIF4G like-domain-containing protein [Lentinula aff. detonsa]|uniref:MIF4G like-domain-containing protein n=1 Tax=Lentinula aff. detonsa TaxID=2804958 RepID=A0AA38KNQ5_9AGAR|nr:MIF4G like-domain-containing protein [Lentinula aff. detonsa]